MNEYEVWTQPATEPAKIHAEKVEMLDSGRLEFTAADQGVIECFQPFAWSRWRLVEADITSKPAC